MRRGFVSRLTPRERNLMGVFVLVLFLMGGAMLFTMRATRFDESETRIEEMRRSLSMLHMQGGVYKERLADKESREAKISSEKIRFASMLEEAQQTALEEGNLRNEEEKPPQAVGDGNLIKRSYSFDVRGVRLGELLTFLSTVEDKPGHILYTDSIDIRSASEVEDRLNASVVVATWELRGKVEESEEPSS
jgi:hypothetical protein